MTLLELVFSITLLVIGITAISRLTLGVTRVANMQRDCEAATEGARAMLERIQAEAFSQAFRSFNGTGVDDPGGPNTAPGANFAVPGLSATADDPDGMPGEIIMPSPEGQPGLLLESVVNEKLAMPHDLNGNGLVDGIDHSSNYKLLPVLVRVRWRAGDGTVGVVELKTCLANY